MLTDWILSKNLKKEKRKRKRNLLPRSKEFWSGCGGQKDRFIKEKRLSGSGKRRGEKRQVCWGSRGGTATAGVGRGWVGNVLRGNCVHLNTYSRHWGSHVSSNKFILERIIPDFKDFL